MMDVDKWKESWSSETGYLKQHETTDREVENQIKTLGVSWFCESAARSAVPPSIAESELANFSSYASR